LRSEFKIFVQNMSEIVYNTRTMISQIGIVLFGLSAVWLIGRKEKWSRWGFILGLMSQPFFIYTAWKHEQWGLFILSICYVYVWFQGIYNYWIKKDSVKEREE